MVARLLCDLYSRLPLLVRFIKIISSDGKLILLLFSHQMKFWTILKVYEYHEYSNDALDDT